MDTGLGVQWPLSPFATAIATGALFAFCVTLWNKRRQPDLTGIPTEDSTLKDAVNRGVPEECGSIIRRHVLKLEIPADIIDTSAFGFPSISVSNEDQPEVLTFALPRIQDSHSDSVTVKLIDFDGRFSKLNFGPFLKDKINFGVPFSVFGNPLICFPKIDPREGLRFKVNVYSDSQKPSYRYYRYPFQHEKFPLIFRQFNQIDKRLLGIKGVNQGPLTCAAKNIISCTESRFCGENFVSRVSETEVILVENKFHQTCSESALEKNDSSRLELENIMNETDQKTTETKSNNLTRNTGIIEEFSNPNISESDNDELKNRVMDDDKIEVQGYIQSESNNLIQNIKSNSELFKRNEFKHENNLFEPVSFTNEGKENYNVESNNLNQNACSDVELENKLNFKIENDVLNQKLTANLERGNTFNEKNENEITSEHFYELLTPKYSKILLSESNNISRGEKNGNHHFIKTPVRLSIEIDEPYGKGSCQKVEYAEPESGTRVSGFGKEEKPINYPEMSFRESKSMKEDLECFQGTYDKKAAAKTTRKKEELSLVLETKQTCTIGRASNRSDSSIEWRRGRCGGGTTTNDHDVRGEGERDSSTSLTRKADEREVRELRQMDRRSRERSDGATDTCIFETSVTSETRLRENGGTRVTAAVTSSLTVDTSDVWSSDYGNGVVKTVVTTDSKYSDEVFRPTYEEYMPDESKSLDATINELKEIASRPLISSEPSSPRVSRLKALLSRDEERRARMKFFQEKSSSVNGSGGAGASIDGEWDRILRDVLASVSELEHWEKDEEQRRRCDVTGSKREDAEKLPEHHPHSDSSPTMEGEAAVLSPTKGETPTKVKNLRFKLDPDVFDVPSDDSFYDDDDDDVRRPGWRRQPKYRTFSTLELSDEPVKLVSVHASVVPAGQKMVARPVGIDLRVRLTEERQSKRAHVGTSPSQVKRRSPVSDSRVGWCQELSPVTENVDWRETFSTVPKDTPETKTVPNGILKSPSPKTEPVVKDSANPFKVEGELTNGTPVVTPKKVEKPKPLSNGVPWKPPERKVIPLPRKKFQPDPEAVDRITGYKLALTKPPLPPPVFHRVTSPTVRTSRAEIARKQYLDSKAALSTPKTDSNRKFQQFLAQAQSDRARIVTSVPDLGAIEKAVSEQWARERTSVSQRASPAREDIPKSVDTPSSRGSTPDDAWSSYVQSCRKHLGRRSQSMTYLETDVDIVDIPILEDDEKWRSTSALGEQDNSESSLPLEDSDFDRSQDDLDDSGRAKSEHELRIQKSLQSLPLPSWYKQSEKPKSGFLLGSGAKEKRGWAAAKSLASSTSSLASCGLKRPIRSLRSSRENIPWSRGSPSPDGPALSLALARAFREPYLGWRARTSTSSGVSSSPRTSPPSWSAATTDEEVNGVSFDGEDAFGRTSSQEDRRDDPPSLDDTGADVATVSMDTGDLGKLPGGEDTCDDINNMSMDTCELFDVSIVPDVEEVPSPQADTGDDIDNLSTDTTEDKRKDPKFKRYSYSQSIYNSEWEEDEESRGDRKSLQQDHEGSPSSDNNKVIWIESSFVGSRTTTSIVVLPDEKRKREGSLERPASR